MRKLLLVGVSVLTLAILGCGNKKLSQGSAESAIKTAITNHTPNPESPAEQVFNVQSLVKITPVNQFSENEASSIAKFKDTRWGHVAFKFIFQKNVDNKWFITKMEAAGPPEGPEASESGHLEMIVGRNENLRIEAP